MGLFDRMRRALSPASFRAGRDLEAARQAELRGDLAKAAALYGRAGANDEVARVMLMRADAEPDPKLRLQHYVQAASIAPAEHPLKKVAQIRRAQMMTLLVKGGPLSAASRADVLQAARDLEELGEAGEAAEAYRLGGDHESEARALAAAGKIEELETLLDRDQDEARSLRKQKDRLEEIDMASATGKRREALAIADAMGNESGGAGRIRGDALRSKRVRGPIVRVEIAGKKATFVLGNEIVIGRSEGEIQIASHAVSRKHLHIARHGRTVVVSDLKSRNGTTLRGMAIGGEIPVGEGIELALGNEVPVRITPSEDFSGAISIEAGGSTYVAFLGATQVGVGDWELVSGA
ncbi:MAG: FHA domain-containing protein, partial [Polyangiaceae bacterium]